MEPTPLIESGRPGNPIRRLLKLADGWKCALLHDFAAATRINELRAEGRTFRQIADALNEEGLRTFRGHRWSPSYVGHCARKFPSASRSRAAQLADQEEKHDRADY